jgi:hypothetical protein
MIGLGGVAIVDGRWAFLVAVIGGGVAAIVDDRWAAGVALIAFGIALTGAGVWTVRDARGASAVDDSQAPEQLALFDIGTDADGRRR